MLVRAVADAGAGIPWTAARAAGLPVPAVRETRCGERRVLVVACEEGQPLAPAVAAVALAQSAALGGALIASGVAVSRLRAGDLHVREGLLAVRTPVAGPADDGDGATADFVAMVAAACAPDQVGPARRRRRAVPIAAAAVAVLAVAVTLLPDRNPSAPAPARAAAAPPPTRDEPAMAPEPAPARVRTPKARAARAIAKPSTPRRRHRPARAKKHLAAPVAMPRPAKRVPAAPADDAVPVAGGDADPLPAL